MATTSATLTTSTASAAGTTCPVLPARSCSALACASRTTAGSRMLLHSPDVLTAEQVAPARDTLAGADWVDGRITAGHQSARVKYNTQLPENNIVAEQIGDTILTALQRHPLFLAAALPLRVFPPLFNRYESGQAFGSHVDNAVRQVS